MIGGARQSRPTNATTQRRGLALMRSLTLLLSKLLNKLVAPEALADGLATLLHHVRVHDVETGPPDSEKTSKDVSTKIPGSRLVEGQAVGKRGEDTHGLRDGTNGVEDVEGGVTFEETGGKGYRLGQNTDQRNA